MKLPDSTLAAGRKLVVARNLPALMAWARENVSVGVDFAAYEWTMSMCFLAQDPLRAIRLHNTVFGAYDEAEERSAIRFRRALWCGVALAIVCGIAALAAAAIVLARMVVS